MIVNMVGVVMCGGHSSRMGIEKCTMSYHGIPQWLYVYNQLTQYCSQVVISCRTEQKHLFSKEYKVVVDNLKDIGPMAGLHAVMDAYPEMPVLVIGCDYPLLQQEDIKLLVKGIFENYDVTTYYNNETQFAEPLLAVYQPIIKIKLEQVLSLKKYSFQSLIATSNALYIPHINSSSLRSFDTPADAEIFLNMGEKQTL